MLILYCIMLFISHGIGSTLFYLERETRESIGFGAIGNFDFSYGRLFGAYSYLLVFLLALFLFVVIFKRKNHTNFLATFLKQQYNTVVLKSTWSILPILLVATVFVIISFWMYSLHIGMIGLQQTELPFHLTGILFYSRRFLFPVVLIWCFSKTRDKDFASILLIIYSLFIGVSSTSKSAALLVLVPLSYMNYIIGKRNMAITCMVASFILYFVIGEMRTVIFAADAGIDIYSVISSSVEYSGKTNIVVYILSNITGRLYGLQSTVLTDQYTQLTFSGLRDYYLGAGINDVIPNFVYTLFGITLPEDKAYGVGLGYTGTMHLLSCHNYLYTILQALIIAVLFSIQNNSIQKIIKSNTKSIYKFVALLVLLFTFLRFFNGNEILTVYIGTIVLVLIRMYAVNSPKRKLRIARY